MDHYKGIRIGVVVQCENGYFAGGRGGGKIYDNNGKKIMDFPGDGGGSHQQNFIDSIKSGKLPNADIGIGHLSGIHCHLANIVARSAVNFEFDAETETILSEPAANAYIKRRYRPHWATPKGV